MGPSFSPNENYPFLSQFLLPEDYENIFLENNTKAPMSIRIHPSINREAYKKELEKQINLDFLIKPKIYQDKITIKKGDEKVRTIAVANSRLITEINIFFVAGIISYF